jgi:hypothetical protein
MRPADTSAAMSEKNNPNKAGNISATDEANTLRAANFVARPEGFETPNPQIRSRIRFHELASKRSAADKTSPGTTGWAEIYRETQNALLSIRR